MIEKCNSEVRCKYLSIKLFSPAHLLLLGNIVVWANSGIYRYLSVARQDSFERSLNLNSRILVILVLLQEGNGNATIEHIPRIYVYNYVLRVLGLSVDPTEDWSDFRRSICHIDGQTNPMRILIGLVGLYGNGLGRPCTA